MGLIDDLENQYSRGMHQYPTGLAFTLNMTDCYVKPTSTFNPRNHHRREDEEDKEGVEMMFV